MIISSFYLRDSDFYDQNTIALPFSSYWLRFYQAGSSRSVKLQFADYQNGRMYAGQNLVFPFQRCPCVGQLNYRRSAPMLDVTLASKRNSPKRFLGIAD
jgi:hypothetical protein